ncbi:hypothetical protein N0V90_004669 [Kalmusia sp. IMI 367209]|nr:hypothetical protein N0V90_004669 [Kalmusia sp. IMI 367209]
MDALPEELLSQIFSYLVPAPPFISLPSTQALRSLCLSSRKLHRIVVPLLYTCVHSISGSAGRQLLRTLEESPALAGRVKYFAVQHTKEGCYRTVEASIEDEDVYGTVEDECAPLALRTVALLPNLTTLDLSRFTMKRGEQPLWVTLAKEHGPGDGKGELGTLTHLRRLSVNLWETPARTVVPFLRLTSLKELELDMRRDVRDRLSFTHCFHTGTKVESLSVIGVNATRQSDLRWLGEELSSLRDLFVAVGALSDIVLIIWLFASHIKRGTVRHIQVAALGLWLYDIETETSDKDSKEIARGFLLALTYATGRRDVEGEVVEVGAKCPGVQRVAMRELTAEEKRAYDLSLIRRP